MTEKATEKQVEYLKKLTQNWGEEYISLWLSMFGVKNFEELTKEQASKCIDFISKARKAVAGTSSLERAKECMKQGLKVVEVLPPEVSADKKAEIAGRWGITFYLDIMRLKR